MAWGGDGVAVWSSSSQAQKGGLGFLRQELQDWGPDIWTVGRQAQTQNWPGVMASPFSSLHLIFFSHLHTPVATVMPHKPNNGLVHSHINVYSESGVPVCETSLPFL